MNHSFAFLCCLAAGAACARPKPVVTPAQAQQTRASSAATSTPVESTSSTPRATPTTTQVSSGPGAHCLYVDPGRRVVRCYWTREDCEQQISFNKGLVDGSQTCEAVVEAHCFDENGKSELCYPTAADCDGMVAKMKKRNRPVSQCASKRGP